MVYIYVWIIYFFISHCSCRKWVIQRVVQHLLMNKKWGKKVPREHHREFYRSREVPQPKREPFKKDNKTLTNNGSFKRKKEEKTATFKKRKKFKPLLCSYFSNDILLFFFLWLPFKWGCIWGNAGKRRYKP